VELGGDACVALGGIATEPPVFLVNPILVNIDCNRITSESRRQDMVSYNELLHTKREDILRIAAK
jgi:hypothetical protein